MRENAGRCKQNDILLDWQSRGQRFDLAIINQKNHRSAFILCVKDKVYFETGSETITRTSYNPSTVSGLVVIKCVDPEDWPGRMVHVEAGGGI